MHNYQSKFLDFVIDHKILRFGELSLSRVGLVLISLMQGYLIPAKIEFSC